MHEDVEEQDNTSLDQKEDIDEAQFDIEDAVNWLKALQEDDRYIDDSVENKMTDICADIYTSTEVDSDGADEIEASAYKLLAQQTPSSDPENKAPNYENVFRKEKIMSPKEKLLAKHRYWLSTFDHEFPLPFIPYKIGVYIRFHNQTKHNDELYLSLHKQRYIDDIALCPRWTLVDFYVDYGSRAPHMEKSPEWCRLLEDCFAGKVNLIVTQLASYISDDPEELAFISRALASLHPPVGIYFISEDIYTTASYYRGSIKDREMLPDNWGPLPEDELDEPMITHEERMMIGTASEEDDIDDDIDTDANTYEAKLTEAQELKGDLTGDLKGDVYGEAYA